MTYKMGVNDGFCEVVDHEIIQSETAVWHFDAREWIDDGGIYLPIIFAYYQS